MMKHIVANCAILVAFPLFLLQFIARCVVGKAHAFQGGSQIIALAPTLLGAYLRNAYYRFALRECAHDAHIGFGSLFSHESARIAHGVYIGPYCIIGDVDIGEDTLIGSAVSIMNGSSQHGIDRLDVPVRDQPGIYPKVTIGKDTWIGDRAIVMADVGSHAVVGAGAVVTKPVPDFAIVVGNPARIVRFRAEPSQTTRLRGDSDQMDPSCTLSGPFASN